MISDSDAMLLALAEARLAAERDEVPVGAVIILPGLVQEARTGPLGERVLARAGNRTITDCDPSAHAEIVAMRAAARELGNYRLLGATLYVTVEPCAMCAGAMIQARIARLVYGCDDPRGGAARSCFAVFDHPALNHRVEVSSGVLAADCLGVLQAFFAARR